MAYYGRNFYNFRNFMKKIYTGMCKVLSYHSNQKSISLYYLVDNLRKCNYSDTDRAFPHSF